MSFQTPWLLLLGLVVVPLLVLEYRRLSRRRAARRAELAALGLVSPELAVPAPGAAAGPGSAGSGQGGGTLRRGARWRRQVPAMLLLGAVTLLLVSLARPQATIAEARREGTVVLAFDVSGSMAATDLAPSRLAAAKAAARVFVERQPPTVRVGVVAFGATGLITQRPSTDKASVLAAVDRLTPQGGTAIGRGIQTSLSAVVGRAVELQQADDGSLEAQGQELGYHGSAAVVLLTDGENTADPDPLAVAELASTAGVKIYAIGLGSPGGTVVQIDGFQVSTKLDEALLQQIAKTTDGEYFAAADEQELTRVYGSIEPTWRVEAKQTEITALFAALAGLLLLVGAGLSFAWFGRVI